jgi:hypothetical protein
MLRICLAGSRVREDLADIVNMAIEELIRQRYELLTEEKRFALAAALLFHQVARAYDDAADMLIRQVQRMHHKAKELMKLRQASHLQHSAELVSTLRNVVGEQWWSLVTGTGNRTILPTRVHHRYLELCVISQMANELKSGDLCSPLGDKFRDYRQQLIPWDQFEREVSAYGDQTGIPTEARPFVRESSIRFIFNLRGAWRRRS